MDAPLSPSTALFDVFLRLRPSASHNAERFLDVEEPASHEYAPTHITIKPPAHDTRKRAVERFAFTRVFEESAGQRDLFEHTGVLPLVRGVLGEQGREGRDGLLATLGVTGSGKSHTILGSKTQRGLTQMTLDVLFRHTAPHLVDLANSHSVFPSLCAADASEAQLVPAWNFREAIYFDGTPSRAATPGLESSFLSSSRRDVPRFSAVPMTPSVDDVEIDVDTTAEYAIVVSMYEVYNDRIFDLLTASGKGAAKRRSLLFKSTEASPDRKVVAGLRKVVCSNLEEALLVLQVGLQERRVAGTGSNAVSSRSHGFFCVEVKKRCRGSVPGPWTSSTLTVVDLAGSERARAAKTAGATLAEAGKINESLMYLGQCMQMQSDHANSTTPALVPFRQCKLTELLFSNSFSAGGSNAKAPQKAIMIVTADPLGDFNATSQILRYSALAREVTVPRIPSTTSTILAGVPLNTQRPPSSGSGRVTPSSMLLHEDLGNALTEQARLREELEMTQIMLAEEIERRRAAEASWRVASSQLDEVEAAVREEVWGEMEARLAQEQRRWRAARDEEIDRQEEHLDRKLAILTQGISVYEDEDPSEEDKENVNTDADVFRTSSGKKGDVQRMSALEEENAALRIRLEALERAQVGSRSPSKKMRVLKTRKWEGSGMGLDLQS
ncbi:Hypothetical protein R9X50_00566600 [Acrodontium crateriforme]|uniref:Kinesin-like protein n=1 Tax=Acrodontium crateriforme TaxID=150365 RepID=A0AAQ3M9S2_9PEZI|nr:Hypothetical protein R9X50_00566600 [Acrodontium crateriforme]